MPEQIPGKLEVQRSDGSTTTITLDGDNGSVSANGDVIFYDIKGKERMRIGSEVLISVQDTSAKKVLEIFDTGDTGITGLWIGRDKESGGNKPGVITLRDTAGNPSITMDGTHSSVLIKDSSNSEYTIRLDGNNGYISVGGMGTDGGLSTLNSRGQEMVKIGYRSEGEGVGPEGLGALIKFGIWIMNTTGSDKVIELSSRGKLSAGGSGTNGSIVLQDHFGKQVLFLESNADRGAYSGLFLGAGGKPGKVVTRDNTGRDSITLDGALGDITLNNADCAEDFDILESEQIEPGTVMVIEQEGKLRQSSIPYDKRVAGVISGARD